MIRGLAARGEAEAKTAANKLALATRAGGGPAFNAAEARILVSAIDALAQPSDERRLELGRLRHALLVVADPNDLRPPLE